MSGWVSSTGWNINLASPGPIGGTTPSSGSFTTLAASSTVSGTGFSSYLASPPAIGGTAAAAGSFTTLNASSNVTLSGGTANGVVYLNGSNVATTGGALIFDGTKLGVGGTPTEKLFTNGALRVTGTQTTAGSGIYLDQPTLGTGSVNVYGPNNATLGQFRVFLATANGSIGLEKMRLDGSGNLNVTGIVATAGYTVATLPSGIPTGSRAYVTDALTPTVLTTVVGGGAVVVPVFYNGSAWIVG